MTATEPVECGIASCMLHAVLGAALVLGGLVVLMVVLWESSDQRKYGGGPHSRKWGAW